MYPRQWKQWLTSVTILNCYNTRSEYDKIISFDNFLPLLSNHFFINVVFKSKYITCRCILSVCCWIRTLSNVNFRTLQTVQQKLVSAATELSACSIRTCSQRIEILKSAVIGLDLVMSGDLVFDWSFLTRWHFSNNTSAVPCRVASQGH